MENWHGIPFYLNQDQSSITKENKEVYDRAISTLLTHVQKELPLVGTGNPTPALDVFLKYPRHVKPNSYGIPSTDTIQKPDVIKLSNAVEGNSGGTGGIPPANTATLTSIDNEKITKNTSSASSAVGTPNPPVNSSVREASTSAATTYIKPTTPYMSQSFCLMIELNQLLGKKVVSDEDVQKYTSVRNELFTLAAKETPIGLSHPITDFLKQAPREIKAKNQPVKTQYGITLEQACEMQKSLGPKVQTSYDSVSKQSKFGYATAEQISNYVDPSKCNTFEFLRLDGQTDLDDATLKKVLGSFLKGRGALSGMEDAFIEAGKQSGVNPIVLVALSCHETANGSNYFSTKMRDSNGNRLFDVYSIGAYDSDPVGGSVSMASNHKWNTLEKAIIGGADWIKEHYVSAGQDTLYKMRFNYKYDRKNNSYYLDPHQYATDLNWAASIASNVNSMYRHIANPLTLYDIPAYS